MAFSRKYMTYVGECLDCFTNKLDQGKEKYA